MNRSSLRWIGLALASALWLGCKSNPCVTCQATVFRGASASVYLSTHPKPQKVTVAPDGGTTYEWIYTREEVTPLAGGGSAGGAGGSSPANPSVISEFLRWLAGGMRDQQVHPLTATQETYFFVTIRTDARGMVQDYSCSSLELSVKAIQRL